MKDENLANYYDLGGTIRCRKPDETLRWLEPILSKIGVTRLANVTGLDTVNIPTYISIRPNAKHLSVSQGKGITDDLAKISALMETVEVYHAENVAAAEILGSFCQLSERYKLVDPQKFMHGFLNATNLSFKEMGWVKAREMNSNELYYIPQSLISLDTSIRRVDHGYLLVGSNGLASGNSLAEAICHGLFEVIERDAMAAWSKCDANTKLATQIRLASISDPVLVALIKKFTAAGIYLKLWDVTSKFGIPSYYCLVQDQNELRGLGKFSGSGTHLIKEIAVARALTEAAQARLTLISGSRDDVFPERYFRRTTGTHLLTAEMQELGAKEFQQCVQPRHKNNFISNIGEILGRLHQHNCNEVFVYDHTKAELNIPVVQVFVPGLDSSKS